MFLPLRHPDPIAAAAAASREIKRRSSLRMCNVYSGRSHHTQRNHLHQSREERKSGPHRRVHSRVTINGIKGVGVSTTVIAYMKTNKILSEKQDGNPTKGIASASRARVEKKRRVNTYEK